MTIRRTKPYYYLYHGVTLWVVHETNELACMISVYFVNKHDAGENIHRFDNPDDCLDEIARRLDYWSEIFGHNRTPEIDLRHKEERV